MKTRTEALAAIEALDINRDWPYPALIRELKRPTGDPSEATKDQLIDLAYSLEDWSMVKFVLDQLPEDES